MINYQLQGKCAAVPVIFYQGEVWLTPRQISDLYKIQPSTVSEHLKKIVASREFPKEEYVHKFKSPGYDGKLYETAHYRLEVVEELGRRTRKSEDFVDKC